MRPKQQGIEGRRDPVRFGDRMSRLNSQAETAADAGLQLRCRIARLDDTTATRTGTVAAAERATADSLRQQLRTYRDEITRLRTENRELRGQLPRHLGAARAAAATTGTRRS